ncbi:SdpI family protein [Flavobacterium plurextorum]|uniref:SdpI family protein n=1 Tax=Flavobacterium plurextorum TaxID=1114867 RepID=UPI0037580FE8
MEIKTLILKNPVILISLIVIVLFKLFPPKKINSFYGYRTTNSIKNKSNWDFAQKYSAHLLIILLTPLLLFQVLLYFIYGSTTIIDLSIVFCLLISFGIVIYKTEKKLTTISN